MRWQIFTAPIAGFAWQSTLYSALSNSSLVVAFVSEDYLKSKMCQEEFAIASSQLASREYDSQLVMVQLERLEGAPADPMFLSCPSISTKDGDGKAKQLLVSWVQRSVADGFRKTVRRFVFMLLDRTVDFGRKMVNMLLYCVLFSTD